MNTLARRFKAGLNVQIKNLETISIGGISVRRTWTSLALAAALVSAGVESAMAQTVSPAPIQLAQGESGGATSGGAASEAPAPPPATEAPAPEPQAEALPPGPVAGPAAPMFAVNPYILGGAVVAGAIVCALVCFSNSSSTTTTSSH
jgi:hypothetical protein